jgi:hypothetical protein
MLYLVNSEDLVNVSEAIRSSEAVSAESLEFPQGFINAINAIINASGSGDVTVSKVTGSVASGSTVSSITFQGLPTGDYSLVAAFVSANGGTHESRNTGTPLNVTVPIIFAGVWPNGGTGKTMTGRSGYYNGSYYGAASLGTVGMSATYTPSAGTLKFTKSGSSAGMFRGNITYTLVAIFKGGSSDGNS